MSAVAVCPSCKASEILYDGAQGNSVCTGCGTVIEENAVVSEVTFGELSNGASVLEGQFISAERGKSALPTIFGRRAGDIGGRKGEGGVSLESREQTLANGKRRLQALAGAVGLLGEHYIDAAHRWYSLALQHQFTRGRKGPNVTAACLYIVCRQEKTPHMLLDFADILSTSVYNLGGTFLRLVRLLNLDLPIIDPSFFVGRFAAKLEFGEKTVAVSNSALRVVARMKRDWIQTGRRPAGVCAAGLLIAARMHGFRRTEAQVVKVVRICEATLKKRLEEFGRTPSSKLTPEEFEGIWLEQEADPPSFSHTRPKPADEDTVHVLPAEYYKSIKQRMIPKAMEEDDNQILTPPTSQNESETEESGSNIIALKSRNTQESKDADVETPEINLSDLDDDEVHNIILDAQEIAIKTELWTELNQDYLQEQEIKQKQQEKENEKDHEVISKKGKEPPSNKPNKTIRKRKSPRTPSSDYTEENIALTPADATKELLTQKKLSKKINYSALDRLFSNTSKSSIKIDNK